MPQPSLLMQCESSSGEEEIPSLFWGLDPVFLAFAKLYIRDILEMKESQQVPGMWPFRLMDALSCPHQLNFPKDTENWGLKASGRALLRFERYQDSTLKEFISVLFLQIKGQSKFFKLNKSLGSQPLH